MNPCSAASGRQSADRQLLRHPGSRAHAPESPGYPPDHRDPQGRVPVRLPVVDRRVDRHAPENPTLRWPGRVIEQIVFASLTLSSRIPDSAFKPEVSTEGFQCCAMNQRRPKEPPENASLGLECSQVATGFKMAARSAQVLPGSTDPGSHLVFSDGLLCVSPLSRWRRRRPGSLRTSRP